MSVLRDSRKPAKENNCGNNQQITKLGCTESKDSSEILIKSRLDKYGGEGDYWININEKNGKKAQKKKVTFPPSNK